MSDDREAQFVASLNTDPRPLNELPAIIPAALLLAAVLFKVRRWPSSDLRQRWLRDPGKPNGRIN